MKQRIEIQVNKSITGLAGYDYGKQIYEEQVKEKINFKYFLQYEEKYSSIICFILQNIIMFIIKKRRRIQCQAV